MEVPDDVFIEIMLLLDDKSLRRLATTTKRTKRIYDSDNFKKLINTDVVFDYKKQKELTKMWRHSIILDYYDDNSEWPIYREFNDNYHVPPRELHDNDINIYREVYITKEELDEELEIYMANK